MSQKSMTRIAIVDPDKCQPNKCQQECRKSCPVNRTGKECITVVDRPVTEESKVKTIARISEAMCIGCNLCKSCPFNAIKIINIPKALPDTIHRYNTNSFKLCNLPIPRAGTVLGLVGANGTGKSSALMVLGNKIIPNFGESDSSINTVLKHYRGTELQNYFKFIYTKKPKVLVKPQYVDSIKTVVKGNVLNVINKVSNVSKDEATKIATDLALNEIYSKDIDHLSGGELQRLAIAITLLQEADIYMFDEPSSYLDIKQRVNMGKCIRDILLPKNKYVIVIEHDLSVLDYLSDYICCLYGEPGVYGIVSPPFTSGEGINVYLDGFVPTDNTRFRDEPLNYRFSDPREEFKADNDIKTNSTSLEYTSSTITYPSMTKEFPSFKMNIAAGDIKSSEIVCLLGTNGSGKTTFIKLLCGLLQPDNKIKIPTLNVSYKPQIINAKYDGTVQEILYNRIQHSMTNSSFKSDVLKPLDIERLFDHEVKTLSGGELQRLGIVLALGKPADIYLIDEPSSFLDVDQRLAVAKVIKRFIMNTKKYCFLVEHDFIIASYCADRVIVLDKIGTDSTGSYPMGNVEGFNSFLKILGITFRRDKTSMRPRINKQNSTRDREQKKAGQYFLTDDIIPPMSSFVAPKEEAELEW